MWIGARSCPSSRHRLPRSEKWAGNVCGSGTLPCRSSPRRDGSSPGQRRGVSGQAEVDL
jgi:hypothetical protein